MLDSFVVVSAAAAEAETKTYHLSTWGRLFLVPLGMFWWALLVSFDVEHGAWRGRAMDFCEMKTPSNGSKVSGLWTWTTDDGQ